MTKDMALLLCDYELRRMCKEIEDFMESSSNDDGSIEINAASAWKLVGTLLEDMHTLHKEIESATVKQNAQEEDPAAEYANDIEDEPIRNAMKESIRRAHRKKLEEEMIASTVDNLSTRLEEKIDAD